MGTSHKDLEMFFILFLNTFQVEEHTSDSDFYNSLSSFQIIYVLKNIQLSGVKRTSRCQIFLSPGFIAAVGNKSPGKEIWK